MNIMSYLQENKETLEKVLKKLDYTENGIIEEALKKASVCKGMIPDDDNPGFTVEMLEHLAGNNFFSINSESLGITKKEGDKIKAYLIDPSSDYDFVAELHEEFPDIFTRENEDYLGSINQFRIDKGLDPINLPLV